jgi:tRNA dimethylallyltransferase
MARHEPILIAGPTASGKSTLALALAERLGGTIINADAMQVYRELRVLTARPGETETQHIPHRLYGHVPGSEAYSAARFAAEAAEAIAEAQQAGRVPIVVGGTGLYFMALTEGLSPIPPIPDDIRSHWRARAAEIGPAALYEVLAARDPVMARRLRPTDPQRLVRALEVLDATGVSLADWQAKPGEPVVRVEDGRAFVVSRDRDDLFARCDARFDVMIAGGAMEEVRALLQLGLCSDLPVMRALGVAPLADLLAGRITAEAAAEAAKTETRRYAKRQLTWLKRNMIAWKNIPKQEIESLVDKFDVNGKYEP